MAEVSELRTVAFKEKSRSLLD